MFNKTTTALATLAALGFMATANAETIDIMVLYTQPAANKVANMETKINALIAEANDIYESNAVDITLNLVKTANASSSDLKPSNGDLDLLTDSSWVQEQRSLYKADMVALMGTKDTVVDGGKTYSVCGLAWVGQGQSGGTGGATMDSRSKDLAFSISAADCAGYTFIHELGHNMGLSHSERQGDTKGGVFVDGMGHGVNDSFSTIMAYPFVYGDATTQLDIFSDPDWNACKDQPCGVPGVSNSYKTLQAVKDDIAAYY